MPVPRAGLSIGRGLEAAAWWLPAGGQALGHPQLRLRCVVSLLQAVLSLLLACQVLWGAEVVPQALPQAACMFVAAATLLGQWRTDQALYFAARALTCWALTMVSISLAACGRKIMPWEPCNSTGWQDIRQPFRVLHLCEAVRTLLEGLSLSLQYSFPGQGVTDLRGHEQLFYRGYIRPIGILIQLVRGLLKIFILEGTQFQRSSLEIALNFARCPLIAIGSCSLFQQWRSSGTGLPSEPPAEELPGLGGRSLDPLPELEGRSLGPLRVVQVLREYKLTVLRYHLVNQTGSSQTGRSEGTTTTRIILPLLTTT
ncbi:unnamed protein product [Polarella glacialis]|uniref:Uncharacterized protein n=1 Tax=Polarella glacialis TaxID=89957 RepID=A0A813DX22_POLGL|nr:unnamed protein product [Polarella glacialis]